MREILADSGRLSRFIAIAALVSGITPALKAIEVNTLRDTITEIPADPDEDISLLRWGPVQLHPRAAASVTYDDNIFITNNNKTDDFIWAFSPGLMLGIGQYPTLSQPDRNERYITLDYNPTFYVFTEHSNLDAVDQNANLDAQFTASKLRLGFHQGYQKLSGADRDVGDRVNRDLVDTRVKSFYQFSEKSSFEVNGEMLIRDYKNQIDSTEFINDDWLNWHISPKVVTSLGVIFGWLNVDSGNPDQTYQQARARAIYNATGKIDLSGSAGVEWRQFSGPQDDRVGLVFDFGADYRVSDATTLSVLAYRRDQNSSVQFGNNYTATGFSGSVRQRIHQNYFLTLAGGYEFADYHETVPGFGSGREDEYFFVRTAFDWNITRHWAAGVFYQYRHNNSTTAFDFDNNQAGVQTSVRF